MREGHYYIVDGFVGLKKTILSFVFKYAKKIPFVKREIAKKKGEVLQSMEKSINKHAGPDVGTFLEIPSHGLSHNEILGKMEVLRNHELSGYIGGRVSGGIYHGGEELTKLITKSFDMFLLTNPLHADLFPSVRKFEAEIVRLPDRPEFARFSLPFLLTPV